MEEELSTEEPDNYACLLKDIKEKFEDEEIANVSNDELLIKDENGNELKIMKIIINILNKQIK